MPQRIKHGFSLLELHPAVLAVGFRKRHSQFVCRVELHPLRVAFLGQGHGGFERVDGTVGIARCPLKSSDHDVGQGQTVWQRAFFEQLSGAGGLLQGQNLALLSPEQRGLEL